jgi:AcrR family transcriptional regulator
MGVTQETKCPGGLRERQRQEREDAILDTALAMVRDAGYTAMTMDDLAARAGISTPTRYAHFPSKQEIAVRAVIRMMRRALRFMEGLDTTAPAILRLEQVLRYVLNGKFVERSTYLGTGRETVGPTLRARPDYQAEYARMVAFLTGLVDEGKAQGAIKPELVTRIAVQSMFSLMRDYEYDDLVRRGECTAPQMIETLIAILLDGLRTRTKMQEETE